MISKTQIQNVYGDTLPTLVLLVQFILQVFTQPFALILPFLLSVVCFSKPPSTFFPLDSTFYPHLFNPPSPPFFILSPISGLSNCIKTFLLILFVVMPVFSPISLSTITIHLIPVFLRVLTGAVMEIMSHHCM